MIKEDPLEDLEESKNSKPKTAIRDSRNKV